MILYRPVGPHELERIEASGMRRFPPRRPEQPFFYPVLERAYAIEIARDWNVQWSGAGFVTRFEISDDVAERYTPQTVGARRHRELWVPAGELATFNDAIQGEIQVVDTFRG